jgi:hypothetical protein
VSQFSANIKARVKRTNNEAVENYFFVWQIWITSIKNLQEHLNSVLSV